MIQKPGLSKRKKDEKRKIGSGVPEEKIKSKERATEMSQGAGYRAGKSQMFENEKKKSFCKNSGRLGVKIKFSLRDLKANKEKESHVCLKDLTDLRGLCIIPQMYLVKHSRGNEQGSCGIVVKVVF